MNTFNHVRLVLAFLSATALCPSTPAQFTPQLPAVADFSELQQVIDAAWVEPMTSALYPPGLSYTNSIHLVAYVPSGFDPSFLAGLKSNSSVAGVPILSGIVRESSTEPLGRAWYGVGPAALTNTPLPSGYDPVQWVLDTFPPTPGILFGDALDHYIADRRLSRQTLAFSLIATNDVPAYMQELEARRAATPPGIAEQDIGVVQIEYIPALDVVDLLVRAPQEVDYLGVYQTADMTPPVTWEPLGTVSHSTDPMPWTFSPAGPRHYLLLANHVLDSDLDGIPDAIEQLISDSDATLADTDGDGLTDYDEVYLYKSNPRNPLTNPSGPSDQEFYGMGVTNHPATHYVSGPINIRSNFRRVARAKIGYPGFKDVGTVFLRCDSRWIYPCYLQTNSVSEKVHTEMYEIQRSLLTYAPPSPHITYDPITQTFATNMYPGATILSNSVEHVVVAWPNVDQDLFQAFPAVSNQYWNSLYDPCTPSNSSMLSEPYTDRKLFVGAQLNFQRVMGWSSGPAWGETLIFQRPMPWNETLNSYEKVDPFIEPVQVNPPWSHGVSHRLYEPAGTTPDHEFSAVSLQAQVCQAFTPAANLPPGYMLKSVLLEVTRDAVTNQFGKGAVIGVMPWRVVLRTQSNEVEAVSIERKRPPPYNPGTVEIMSGYIDLSVPGAGETTEDNPGVLSSRCTNLVVTLSGLTRDKLEAGKYRLKLVAKPDGSTAGLRLVGSTAAPSCDIPLFPAPSGPQPATNAYELVAADNIGLYNISLEVSGTNEQALHYWPTTVVCDKVNTRVDFVQEIPAVMDTLTWPTAAAFMRRWQAGVASTNVSNAEADTTSITYNELCLIPGQGVAPKIQDAHTAKIWQSDSARGMMWKILTRQNYQPGQAFGISSACGRDMWPWQVAVINVLP